MKTTISVELGISVVELEDVLNMMQDLLDNEFVNGDLTNRKYENGLHVIESVKKGLQAMQIKCDKGTISLKDNDREKLLQKLLAWHMSLRLGDKSFIRDAIVEGNSWPGLANMTDRDLIEEYVEIGDDIYEEGEELDFYLYIKSLLD